MRSEVSIIMPVLNGERYIGEAIGSIAAQTYPHFEVIVVDDGCTDGTSVQVQRFANDIRIQYMRHATPQGIPRSMNDGVRQATGDFIAFLDHDDLWMPDFLHTQVAYLEAHPEVGLVHSDFQTIDVEGNVLENSVAACRERKRPSGQVFRELLMDSFIVGNSVLIRRECFTKLGLFDEELRWGDYHMWLRIARNYRVDYVPKVLTKYRQHPTQSTRSVVVSRPDADSVALQAVRKILELYPEVRSEIGDRAIRRRMATLYFDMAYSWYWKGENRNARVCMKRALAYWPGNPRYLLVYAATLLPARQVEVLRGFIGRSRRARPSVTDPAGLTSRAGF